MKFFSLILLGLVGIAAALGVLNLGVLLQSIEFDLGFTSVKASMGLLLIGWLALTTLAFLAFAIYVQTSALLESRRQSKEMQSMRQLTDQAEASRITELRAFMEARLQEHAATLADVKAELLTVLSQSEKRQLAFAEQSGNTLAAYIGELEGVLKSRP